MLITSRESLFAVEQGEGTVARCEGKNQVEFARLSVPDEHDLRPLYFAPDDRRLYVFDGTTRQIFNWHLAPLRREQDELGLDNDWPPISRTSTSDIVPAPLKVVK